MPPEAVIVIVPLHEPFAELQYELVCVAVKLTAGVGAIVIVSEVEHPAASVPAMV